MKLREDQIRLQSLLKETITVLCKNGVHFEQGFVIDALIGITTDNQSTFLIKLEETIGNTSARNEQALCDNEAGGRPNMSNKRPPDGSTDCTPRKRSRSEINHEPEHSLDVSVAKVVSCNKNKGLGNRINDDTIEAEDDDLVFVKQEHSSIRYAQADQSHACDEEADDHSSHVGPSPCNSSATTDVRPENVRVAVYLMCVNTCSSYLLHNSLQVSIIPSSKYLLVVYRQPVEYLLSALSTKLNVGLGCCLRQKTRSVMDES